MAFVLFFFSSRRRHTRCALVTGVQTCALPICSRRPQLSRSPLAADRTARIGSDGGAWNRSAARLVKRQLKARIVAVHAQLRAMRFEGASVCRAALSIYPTPFGVVSLRIIGPSTAQPPR